MAVDVVGFLKPLIERLDFSIGLAACAASGFVAFSPWMEERVTPFYRTLALIVFIFTLVWVVWEAARWAIGRQQDHKATIKTDRQILYTDIYRMQNSFGGFRGMLADPKHHLQAAAEIGDKYARLNKIGIQTPQIDPTAVKWDFDPHNEFLTGLMPVLLKSPMSDVKKHARSILGR